MGQARGKEEYSFIFHHNVGVFNYPINIQLLAYVRVWPPFSMCINLSKNDLVFLTIIWFVSVNCISLGMLEQDKKI